MYSTGCCLPSGMSISSIAVSFLPTLVITLTWVIPTQNIITLVQITDLFTNIFEQHLAVLLVAWYCWKISLSSLSFSLNFALQVAFNGDVALLQQGEYLFVSACLWTLLIRFISRFRHFSWTIKSNKRHLPILTKIALMWKAVVITLRY